MLDDAGKNSKKSESPKHPQKLGGEVFWDFRGLQGQSGPSSGSLVDKFLENHVKGKETANCMHGPDGHGHAA